MENPSPNIIVTGAARGIGKAIADALIDRGASVVALSSKDGDLGDTDVPARLWAEALEKLGGRVDALINNAGCLKPTHSTAAITTGSQGGIARCRST